MWKHLYPFENVNVWVDAKYDAVTKFTVNVGAFSWVETVLSREENVYCSDIAPRRRWDMNQHINASAHTDQAY